MTASWPWIAVPLASALVALGLALYVLRLRRQHGALAFSLMALAASEWSLAYAFELIAPTLETKVFWGKLQYIGTEILPIAWLVFSLEYTGRRRWVTRPVVFGLSLIPALTLALVFTTELHQLMWVSSELASESWNSVLAIRRGLWFPIAAVNSYLQLGTGTLLLVTSAVSAPHVFRKQALLMATASLIPFVANLLYVYNGSSIVPRYNPTPSAMAVAAFMIWLAVFRYRLFDLRPLARATVFDHMVDCVVVLDSLGRVADINPAALRLLHLEQVQAIGKQAASVFSGWRAPLLDNPADPPSRERLIAGGPAGPRYIESSETTLREGNGNHLGKILVFRDVTEVVAARTEHAQLVADRARLDGAVLTAREIAHLVMNDISAAVGALDLMKYQYGVPADVADMAEVSAEGLARAVRHIQQLQQVARIATKNTPVGPSLDLAQSSSPISAVN